MIHARRNGGDVGTAAYHLAQLNVARMNAPLTDPVMADFVANLEPINALAERSPGFVWRLQTDGGDATALRPYLRSESRIRCRARQPSTLRPELPFITFSVTSRARAHAIC
jgi:Domain of unknown function (DUF3291)